MNIDKTKLRSTLTKWHPESGFYTGFDTWYPYTSGVFTKEIFQDNERLNSEWMQC